MNPQQFWVVVVARDHALFGIQTGILQANHGKAAPLHRMRPGDGVLIYAPKLIFGQNEPCQRFVALGTIADEPVYQAEVTPDFKPFRRRVIYESVVETPIQPVIEQLSFITDKKRWGYWFRFSCFAIPQTDFDLLHATMTDSTHD